MSRTPAAPPCGRGLLSLLAAYAVALAVCLVPAGAMAAPDVPVDEAVLQVRLDAVTPAIAGPGTDVTVSGTLTNAGPGPAQVDSVRVSTALRGLDTREAVEAWSSQGSLETPVVVAEDLISAAVVPGAVVRFYARVPAGELDPGFDFATLPLRIEVTGAEAAGQALPQTELRTFLPWQAVGADAFTPIELAWVAPLTLPGGPALVDPDDGTRGEAWTAAIGPDSANVALLAGLSGTAATFVVDPAMLEPLDPVASLTEAVQPPGDPGEPGDGPTDPTEVPTDPTSEPTSQPTDPTPAPTSQPTDPTSAPTSQPTDRTSAPTVEPANPSSAPTVEPAPQPPPTPSPGSPGAESDSDQPGSPPDGAPAGGDVGDAAQQTGPAGDDATSSVDGSEVTSPATTATPPGDPTETPTEEPEPVEPPTPPATEAAVLGLSALLAPLPPEQLWWLPVGDTDTGALLDVGAEPEDVAALVGRPPAQPLVTDGRTDIAWPVSAQLDDSAVGTLTEVWELAGGATGAAGPGEGSLAGVVLPTSAIEGELLTGSAVHTHATGTRLLAYDERLSAVVAAAQSPQHDGRSVQRFLAETMATYQERPAVERSLVVAIPRGTHVDAQTLQALTEAAAAAPWLAETTAGELLQGPVGSAPATVAPPAPAEDAAADRDAPVDGAVSGTGGDVPARDDLAAYTTPGRSPLTAPRVAAVEQAREALGGASEIVPGSEDAHATWLRVLDRQYSARWRHDSSGWSAPVERADALSEEILSGLTINPTTINFFADEGLIRITVTNDLPVQIDNLRMTVSPGNARLRILAQPEPITIGPESRATVQFRARAVAAGEVPLNTTLSTPGGTPVGEQAETSVRVRPAGVWIYWLLGGVAGVILVLGLVRALRPRSPSTPSEQKVAPTGSDTESP